MQRYLFLLIPAAILLRFYLSTLGHNYDMESFERVAWAGWRGESVYAATDRYNYAPLWFFALTGLKHLQIFFVGIENSFGAADFHSWVTSLVIFGELFLFFGLRKCLNEWRTPLVAVFFSPVAILLTGYHSQFDVWALAFGAWAWHFAVQRGQWTWGAVLMGLSLAVKHWLIFLPALLVFAPNLHWRERIGFSAVSYGLFLASFLPFVFDAPSRAGILRNVFGYSSADGIALLPYMLRFAHLGGEFFKLLHPFLVAFSVVWAMRKISLHGALGVYVLIFVAAAPAMATQYLYAPAAMLFFLGFRGWAWAFSLWGAAFLALRSPTNIGAWAGVQEFYAEWARPAIFWDAFLSVYALQAALFVSLAAYFLQKRTA